VLSMAGRAAEGDGNYVDSIQLLTMAEQDDAAIGLLVKHVARYVSNYSAGVERKQFLDLAKRYLARAARLGFQTRASSSASSTPKAASMSLHRSTTNRQQQQHKQQHFRSEALVSLQMLVHLSQYFDCFYAGADRFDDALQILDSLGLIAVHGDKADMEAKLTRFAAMDTCIKQLFADVADKCMEMYFAKFKLVKQALRQSRMGRPPVLGSAHPQDVARQNILRQIRSKARALVNFIGMNQLYIGTDVNAKLVRLEALMS
jgi:hypothetical protein